MTSLYRHIKRACFAATRHAIFLNIYRQNRWADPESRSGPGSTLLATKALREQLPDLIQRFGIRSLVDVPCGDFNWMKEVKIQSLVERYRGLDIVPDLIRDNTKRFGSRQVSFQVLDMVKEVPPAADLILCRHLLIHLTLKEGCSVIRNMKRSGSTYLLVTNQPQIQANTEMLVTGGYRGLNLELAPFHFPEKLWRIDDAQSQDDLSELGLYRLQDI
jgi:hypothetical protein